MTFPTEKSEYFNSGYGIQLSLIEIGMEEYVGVIEPDLAFWAVMKRADLAKPGSLKNLSSQIDVKRNQFSQEMERLRFGLTPSAVYFNPTDRCNLDCSYCYLPSDLRKNGTDMSEVNLSRALSTLKDYFNASLPEGVKPQIIFHGSEPLLVRDTIFSAIESFANDFSFGIQTNGQVLDETAVSFIKRYNVGVGISIDGATAVMANKNRKNWAGDGTFDAVIKALDMLVGYQNLNVICTVTSDNVAHQTAMVDFMHKNQVAIGMLNYVRCTQKGGQRLKPDNQELATHFINALDRSYELYEKTGQKLIIANFANILLSLVAPAARRLMCDISPCGGGRAFFAVSAEGNMFPCSEFIGMADFCGGNIFEQSIEEILQSDPFKQVTRRVVEQIDPCSRCAIKHFCGAPCPAEVVSIHKTFNAPSDYCSFFEEQVRYALRLLALERHDAYLYDDWKKDTNISCNITSLL